MAIDIQPTGIPGLDVILGGGLPRGSAVMIAGAPGTGKTILVQQLCFRYVALAPPGEPRRAVYFSTLSEPHDKLISHSEVFSFFDPQTFGDGVEILSLQAFLDTGLDGTAAAIVNQARQSRAGLVTIDGFRAVEGVAEDRREIRRFLYRLSAQLGVLGTTLVVTTERSADDAESFGEFTTADGVIALYNRLDGVQQRRRLEVRKLRGMAPLAGLHSYQISDAGWEIYPRLETLVGTGPIGSADGPRVAFDRPELDAMLHGGLPAGSATHLAGSPGTGKTTLGLYYLAAGLRRGEPGLFVSFNETRAQLLAKGRAMHLDLDRYLESGLLTLQLHAPVELDLDRFSTCVCQDIDRTGARRLVIDSIGEVERAASRDQREADFGAALHSYLRAHGVTSLFAKEIGIVVGPDLDVGDSPLAVLCENVVVLRYLAFGEGLHRILAIIKMRDSDHDWSIREFRITTTSGLAVLRAGESASGELTGVADLLSGRAAPRRPARRSSRAGRHADG